MVAIKWQHQIDHVIVYPSVPFLFHFSFYCVSTKRVQ
jgi:hypothetical protein